MHQPNQLAYTFVMTRNVLDFYELDGLVSWAELGSSAFPQLGGTRPHLVTSSAYLPPGQSSCLGPETRKDVNKTPDKLNSQAFLDN